VSRTAWWLALLCLGARLGFLLAVRPWDPGVEQRAVLQGDALNYHRLAITLLEHGRFAETAQGPPVSFRTPLYPAAVAGLYAVTGPRPWVVLIAQSVLDCCACLLLWLGLRRLFAPPAATIGAALYALDPFMIFYCAMLLTDTMFVFLLVAALFTLTRSLAPEARVGRWIALTGALLGAATLVRPPSQYLPILVAPFLVIRHRRPLRHGLGLAALFVAAFALVLAPWIWRNQRTFGVTMLSTAAPHQMVILYAAPVLAEQRGLSSAAAEHALLEEANADMRAAGLDPAAANDIQHGPYYRRVAMRHISRAPAAFARAYVRGMVNSMLNLNTSGFALLLGQPSRPFDMKAYRDPIALLRAFFVHKQGFAVRLALTLAPFLILTYLATVLGVAWRLRAPERDVPLLLLATAIYFLAVGGAGSGVRYKLPALPFLLGFTGTGVAVALEWLRSRFGQRVP
jgi:4-amino-4-deoxy-L-arabinose transferase-like glycosyltransferase